VPININAERKPVSNEPISLPILIKNTTQSSAKVKGINFKTTSLIPKIKVAKYPNQMKRGGCEPESRPAMECKLWSKKSPLMCIERTLTAYIPSSHGCMSDVRVRGNLNKHTIRRSNKTALPW